MQEKIWDTIIKNLTEEQTTKIVTDLGSLPPKRDGAGNLIFQSVCHHSSSWKLCYYKDSHNFFCYRDWESFNIFSLVMQVKKCEFAEAFKYVCDILNIKIDATTTSNQSFHSDYAKDDWDIFDKFDKLQTKLDLNKNEENEIINPKILDLFTEAYYEGWIAEHISIRAMQKYNIKYDIVNKRIIIPHYDINNYLIGIRCRNLSPASGAKYCPITIEGKLYNHPLTSHLYGLNHNKDTIKKISKVMIVESEKAVQQSETYFPDNNFVVACCGSNISYEQIKLLIDLGVTEVILGMDWDFKTLSNEDNEYQMYKTKILKLCQKLIPYFTVEVLLPQDDKFIYKCSPTDLGKEYLINSMKNKISVDYDVICTEKLMKERSENSARRNTN